MKNYLLLLSTCLIFANNQHPTQEQVDEMLNGAMQLIWQEAMQAKNITNQLTPQIREELLDNLCSSAPNIQLITHADLSDSQASA